MNTFFKRLFGQKSELVAEPVTPEVPINVTQTLEEITAEVQAERDKAKAQEDASKEKDRLAFEPLYVLLKQFASEYRGKIDGKMLQWNIKDSHADVLVGKKWKYEFGTRFDGQFRMNIRMLKHRNNQDIYGHFDNASGTANSIMKQFITEVVEMAD